MAETATIHPINKDAQVKNDVQSQPTANEQSEKVSKSKQLTQALPTNRMTIDRQLLLLRAYAAAYAHYNEPLSIRQVGAVAKMDRTGISMANAFLVETGLVEKVGIGFVPSQAVIAFNHAYEWNAETAPQKLAPVLQQAWFVQRLAPFLMLGSLTEENAIRELAAASNAAPEHRSQLKMILELTEKAGVVKREGDSYVRGITFRRSDAAAADPVESTPAPPAPPSTPEPREQARDVQMRSSTTTTFNQMTAGAVQFSINVKVDVSELAGWEADRIKALFAGIAQVLAAKADVEQDIDA